MKEDRNVYYINTGQAQKHEEQEIIVKQKTKERQKRVREKNARRENDFDRETETVIQMTNQNKIKKEEDKKRKTAREEQKKKKRNRKIKIVLKMVLLGAFIAGGITFTMVSPIFNIQDIQVENNEKVSSQTIVSLSQLKTGENIFRFNRSKVVEQIKENPYIENVEIHRRIPNMVQIEIEERVHRYSVDFLGKYAYINSQGYILEIAQDNKQKTVIQGITTSEEQVVEGKRLNQEDLQKIEDVIKIMDVTKEYHLDMKVTSIDIQDKNEYSIYLEEEKKKVYLGDSSNLSNKMLYVNAVIEEEKGKAGEIFANGDLNNKFRVYFRESLNI